MRNPVLEALFTTGQTVDAAGETRDVFPTGIPRDMGEAITALIRQKKCLRTMEIGCAYGVSSLFICQALEERREAGPHHVIIDPFQSGQFNKAGILNLERAGFDFFELIEEPSERALPRLWEQGRRFDFALIDGRHTMDQVMLDFFYVDKLLDAGGIVVLDDIRWPGIGRAARYLSQYPSYRTLPPFSPPRPMGWVTRTKHLIAWCSRLLPMEVRRALLAAELIASTPLDPVLRSHDRFLAMEKCGEDVRPGKWHVHL